jgi:hypothetical protein
LIEVFARFPSVDRDEAFAIVIEAFQDLVKPFLRRTRRPIHKKLLELLKGDAAAGTPVKFHSSLTNPLQS